MSENLDLILVQPEVMAVRAAQQHVDDVHVKWFVGFAPEYDTDSNGRVVFGTLHGAGEDGIAEVEVACTMCYSADLEPGVERFGEILAGSDALETLWDVARIAFRAIAATTNLSVQAPAAAPPAHITQLVRAQGSAGETDGAEVSDPS